MAQIWSEKGILIFVFYFYGTFFTSFFFAIHPTNTRNRIKNGRKTEKWKKRQRQEIKMKWNREKEKEKNWSVRKKKLKMQRVCLSDSGHMTRNNFSRNQTRCTSICILYLWSQRVKLVSMWKKSFWLEKASVSVFFTCNATHHRRQTFPLKLTVNHISMQIRTVHFQRLDVDHALIEKRHRYQQEKRVHFLHSLTSRNWLVCRVSPSCWRYDSQCWLQFARLRLINTLAGVIIAPIDEWTTRTQQTSVKDAHFSLWKQIQKNTHKVKEAARYHQTENLFKWAN